ncbi:MAG: hypothetical protein N2201_06335 [candidate division WOR-3 bacterium]|nr:hypothetical protein [candidate division WOR-3 bacterium]
MLFSIVLTVENAEVNKINIQSKSDPVIITIPKLLNYQGKLTNLAGVPVADSQYSITF